MGYTDQYPDGQKQADLDALDPATIADFRLGLTYKTAERVGQNLVDDDPLTTEDVFILREHTVEEFTIERDLLDFKNAVAAHNAYEPTFATTTTTTTSTTTAP